MFRREKVHGIRGLLLSLCTFATGPDLNLRAAYLFMTAPLALPAIAAPEQEPEQIAAAYEALQRGDAARADALSEQSLALHPNSVKALLLRGQILAMKGQPGQAEKLLLRACQLAPNNPQAYFQLGMFYDGRQLSGKAAEQFERVIRLSPENPRAYDYLALSLEPLGEFERAEWAYKKGLAVNRGPLFDSFLDYNYGRFLMKMNRLEEAAARLDRAVELAPETRAVHYERAKLKEKLGKHEQARLDAEQALSLKDPTGVILDLQVYYLLGRVYSRLGERELAAKYTKLTETTTVPVKSRIRGGR